MAWEVEFTDEFKEWWDTLSVDQQDTIDATVEVLEERGPGLGRPLVDTVKGSQLPNMKELRPPRGNLRILFAFDPRRTAIILLGGDKTNQWQAWYQEAIPKAEALYYEYIRTLRREGELP